MIARLRQIAQYIYDFLLPPAQSDIRIRSITHSDLPLSPLVQSCNGVEITTLWNYTDPMVRDIIWSLKYRKNRHAARTCANALAEYLREILIDQRAMYSNASLVVIPVPLASGRYRSRGYNQIDLVLEELHTSAPFVSTETRLLRRVRETRPQTRLHRAERLRNVDNAFSLTDQAHEALRGTYVLLVDDVATTGATLAEASRPLQEAGIRVECIALARARE